jgi:hypothetical protein
MGVMGCLLFGSEQSDHVRTEFRGWAFPNRRSAHDDWMNVWIEIVTGPFSGSYEAQWLAGMLPPFRTALERLYETLDCDVRFTPDWEGSLVLILHGDGLGHVSIKAEACPNPATGPWLRFELPDIDQTFLVPIIDALREQETQFPVR